MAVLQRIIRKFTPMSPEEKALSRRDFLFDQVPADSVGAEIGVLRGDFTARVLDVAKPSRYHLIDPWYCSDESDTKGARWGTAQSMTQAKMDAMHDSVAQRFANDIQADRIIINRQGSVEAAAQFEDEYFDWVYIDGNHLYEAVKADLEYYLPKVKRGGFLMGDDYDVKGWWGDGLNRAVDEFRAASEKSGACKTVRFRRGQFIFQRKT